MSSRIWIRVTLLAALLLAMALPTTAVMMRLRVHFKATFDNPHGSDITVVAPEIGFFESSKPDSFPIEVGLAGNGHLTVSPMDGSDPAALRAVLNPPFFGGGAVYASMLVTPSGDDGSLDMRFLSEDDTPIIDVGFSPDGAFDVDGDPIGLSWDPGVTYWVMVEFSVPDFGMASYKVTIASDVNVTSSGVTMPVNPVVTEGPLGLGGAPLDLATIEFAVPAGIEGDLFELDNLRVVSPGSGPLHLK